MPKPTFFRLPDEKRARLIAAAREEFTRVSFSEASISRIIKAAGIPRGSFYQYFENKADIFSRLIEELRMEYEAYMAELLTKTRGDLFEACMLFFDAIITEDGLPVPRLSEVIRIFELNQELDFQQILFGKYFLGELHGFHGLIDVSQYRKREPDFAYGVQDLLLSGMVCAVTAVLRKTGTRDEIRNSLSEKIDIIKFGALASGRE